MSQLNYLVILGNDKDAISSHLTEKEFNALQNIIETLLQAGVEFKPTYKKIMGSCQ